jgi:hypothetical protein
VKFRINVFVGYIILLIGIGMMFHPTFQRGVNNAQVQVGDQEATVHTEEVITMPRWVSFLVIVGGGLLILMGSPRLAQPPSERRRR